MKVKKSPVGQNILDGLGDTENGYIYIEGFIPWIGEIVVAFNGLEASLDSVLCETFSDRSDQKGLLVLHSMMYSTKVDLYKKFNDDFIRAFDWDFPEYKDLISALKECGVLRNKVVHANWEYTDEEGYTQVKYKVGNVGLEHELCQFSEESLNKIVGRYAASGAIAGPLVELDVRTLYLKDLSLLGCTVLGETVFPNLIKHIEMGKISPVVAKTFSLFEIPEAQKQFETKGHIGKFVIDISSEG